MINPYKSCHIVSLASNTLNTMEMPEFDCKLSQKYPHSLSSLNTDDGKGNDSFSKLFNSTMIECDQNHNCFNDETDTHINKCFDDFGQKPLVVGMRNVHFRYKHKEKLIENLNLNINTSQIYGLLGPSGCGKSTTLKLILGLLKPQKGKVLVFGNMPYTVMCPIPGIGAGYMPQELALMPTMTVADNFNYYGHLNGMKDREIGKRCVYLTDLLQIPSLERPVEKLSGGQQRRTSLALALLHSPPLLVLDEPTVGIDPLLRNKIWSYLHELALKEGKTIIITTHYIEEARNAHTIALMRYGRLLAETNPDRLLHTFQMSTIEEVFLNLCEKDTENNEQPNELKNKKRKNLDSITNGDLNPSKQRSEQTTKFSLLAQYPDNNKRRPNFYFEWTRVWAIIHDTFTYMNGKFATIFIATLLPTLQILLFHFSIGKPITSLPISVISRENQSVRFSDVLLDRLQSKTVHVEYHQTVSEALASVRDGYTYAAFEFKDNFTRCLTNRVRKGYESSEYDIDCSRVRMSPDNTYQFIIFQLALELRDAFMEAIYQFFPKMRLNPETLNIPVKVEELVYGTDHFSYQEFMTPGMYMALVYMAPLIVTLFVLLEQKVYGQVERSRAAGAKPLEILTAHFVTNFCILTLQIALMMMVSLNYFEAQNHGSLFLLLAIVFLVGLAGISLAILMAAVMNNKLAALVFTYGLTVSLWMICGVFWPIQNITLKWVRKGVIFLPLTLPIETARNIMNRGWTWNHIDVLLGFGSGLTYCAVPLLLAYLVFK